jgi:hypothetical protein
MFGFILFFLAEFVNLMVIIICKGHHGHHRFVFEGLGDSMS